MSLSEDVEKGVEKSKSNGSIKWYFGDRALPREEVVFFCQISIIMLIVIVGLINLCLGNGPESYWSGMVATGAASVLPPPKIKKSEKSNN